MSTEKNEGDVCVCYALEILGLEGNVYIGGGEC